MFLVYKFRICILSHSPAQAFSYNVFLTDPSMWFQDAIKTVSVFTNFMVQQHSIRIQRKHVKQNIFINKEANFRNKIFTTNIGSYVADLENIRSRRYYTVTKICSQWKKCYGIECTQAAKSSQYMNIQDKLSILTNKTQKRNLSEECQKPHEGCHARV